MKKYSILFFLFFLVMGGIAQDTTVTWISQNGKPVEREMATYLRHYWQEDDSLWQVRDYFPEGNLQMSGAYADEELKVKQGNFCCFAESGAKTSEGVYDHNVAEGFWNFWDDDGKLKDHGKFISGTKDVERDSIFNIYKESKNISLFTFPESIKDSTWEYFHENGVRSGLEHYESGRLTASQYWNADGSEVLMGAVVDRMPEFPGGVMELMHYLKNNIKYPKVAKRKRVVGTVYVNFEVDKDGAAKNFIVYESVSPEIDNEALRVLQSMPRWTPGMAQNRAIKVQYNLPLKFSLR